MKYSDCPTITASTTIKATAADVWALVSDISLPVAHSNELQAVEWIGDVNAGALGAQFRGQNANAAIGAWETTSIVTKWDPGRVFEWAVGDPNHPSASWRFTITPMAGGVELEQWFQIGPGPSGLSPAIAAVPDKEERILTRRLESQQVNMQANLDAIKDALEG
ncbi:MAG: SRPBCC family protein [Acidimicrobiales bacterium]|nr:SRPBCC family protein [Acidimicrobiales bacterium]